jgi:putative ABC transport system permease protein
MFRNSLAETLTETEKAFQLGFVAMTEAIVVAIRIVSFLVIFIIMAVMANTMAMTARDAANTQRQSARFRPLHLSLVISVNRWRSRLAALRSACAHVPVAGRFARRWALFPVFNVSVDTVTCRLLRHGHGNCRRAVSMPARRISHRRGLRHVG